MPSDCTKYIMTKFIPKQYAETEPLTAEELLKDVYALLENLVEYEPCDCGCPWKRSPASARDVQLMRVLSYIRCNSELEFPT